MARAGVSLEGIAGSIITQKAISKITDGLHGVTGITPYILRQRLRLTIID